MYTRCQEKKRDYQLAIKDDPLLSALADTIIAGWPDDIKDVPKALRPYHGIPERDSLNCRDAHVINIVHPGTPGAMDKQSLQYCQRSGWTYPTLEKYPNHRSPNALPTFLPINQAQGPLS